MKSILIGSVYSSKIVLEQMIKANFPIDMVFSLDEKYSENVSGYYPIHDIAIKKNMPYKKFRHIGDQENKAIIQQIEPDYIFLIGLSQLVKKDIIDLAKIGVIGFHPTPLPQYRGRAAMVWQVLLGIHETRCSMFFINEEMDAGDVIGQETYYIEDTDYASDIGEKLLLALEKLTARILGEIKNGTIYPQKQDESKATYLLMRTPEDGEIDWKESVEKIQRLIRAVSKPYPGAFTHYEGKNKFIIWRADYIPNSRYIGIPGQIAEITINHIDVVAVDGILRIYNYDNIDDVKLRVGHKFK